VILGIEAVQGENVAPGARIIVDVGAADRNSLDFQRIRHQYVALLLQRALSGLDLAHVTVDKVRVFEVILPGEDEGDMREEDIVTYMSPEAPKIAVVPQGTALRNPHGPRRG